MLMMLALSCRSGPARGPADADDARLVVPLLALSCRSGAQLMLMMLALSCRSGPARGPADADDARLVVLRPSKGPS